MKISLLLISLFFSLASYGQIAIIFDGTDFGPNVIPRSWGQSTMEIDAGSGPDGANAIRWVQGDEYGNGSTGIQFTARQPLALAEAWPIALFSMKIKCGPGTDSLRLQCVSLSGKKGTFIHPVTDNQWHKYSFPLRDFVYMENSSAFDPGSVTTIDLMAERDAVAGQAIYITDWYITTAPTLVLFNGIAIPLNLDVTTWGGTQVDVLQGMGPGTGSNVLQWIQGGGETGFRFNITPACNLAEVWNEDSLKFRLKTASAIDSVTLMLFSAGETNVVGVSFVPVADDQWHQYAFPLRDMIPLRGTAGFDPNTITCFEVRTGQTAGQGVAGATACFTDFWTGNPYLDRVPPAAPTDLCLSPAIYTNLIMWTDVPGETGERYNVYYSENPITDVTKADVVTLKIKEDVQQVEHLLFSPSTDQEVSYYYAITCTDVSGNVSRPAFLDPTPNTARGIPVISLRGPGANFIADGDLSEWTGIRPFRRKPSDGNQYVVSWGVPFNNDGDLAFDAYIAMDSAYLYVAFDVTDDVVSFASSGSSDQDSPDFHIGLYNWHGAAHSNLKRGAQPDYLLRFSKRRPLIDLGSRVDTLLVPGENYYWGKNAPKGYRIEARLPWTLLAEQSGDSLFVPIEGYRVPLDIMINDADQSGVRESMLELSPFSDGHSAGNPALWVYTWIGDKWQPTTGVGKDQTFAEGYALAQNYPNPFNPTTRIKYTVGGTGVSGLGTSNTGPGTGGQGPEEQGPGTRGQGSVM